MKNKKIFANNLFKSKNFKSVFKIIMLACYCALICAAVLFSFKSVFDAIMNPNNQNSAYNFESAPVLSKIGARGEDVAKIQSALKNFGYYLGGVDGVFGVKTQDALMRFQEARGLANDGIAGTQTLKALGLQVEIQTANNENDINLLARFISAEARGEPYAGQIAVGAVVLNRVNHPAFPNSISAVIYQPNAFPSIKNGKFDAPVSESAYRAARDALNNIDPVGGATYFYKTHGTSEQWLRSRPVIATIGSYAFCS